MRLVSSHVSLAETLFGSLAASSSRRQASPGCGESLALSRFARFRQVGRTVSTGFVFVPRSLATQALPSLVLVATSTILLGPYGSAFVANSA